MQTALFGDPSSTQSAIIVPVLNSSTEYYIFTADDLNGPNGLAPGNSLFWKRGTWRLPDGERS